MSGKPRLYLVRHGATAWNLSGRFAGQRDIPLAPEGERQATALGLALRDHIAPDSPLFSSDLLRARATARLIAAAGGLKTPLRVDANLREASFGQWEGLTWSEIEAAHPEWALQWTLDYVHRAPPGGESLEEVAARGGKAIAGILATGAGANAPGVVVSHGGLIRAVLARFALGDLGRFWDFNLPPASAVLVSAEADLDVDGPGGAFRFTILSILGGTCSQG